MGIFTKKEKKQIRKSTLRLETLEDRMLLAISAGGEAAAAEIVAAPEATEAAAEIVLTDTSSASLRTALKNIAAGGTITYDASLEGETVDVNDKGYGTVQITKNVTIIGNGVNFTNSNTNGKGQIFRIGAKQVEAGTTAVTFRDMVFTGGSATGYNSETDGISNSGAAIYCVYPGVTSATPSSTGPTITIDSCEFYDNTCGTIMASYCYGGAVYLYGADGVITNCTFSGNSSAIYGGALHVMASNLTMDNCDFTNNSALCGGAVSVWAGFNVTISDCNFTENAALSYEDGFEVVKPSL